MTPIRSPFFVAAFVFFAFATRTRAASADDNFRSDVVDCEDAVAHLTECCPGFDQRALRCQHADDATVDQGCDYSTTTETTEDPSLSRAESACILQRSCANLVSSGVCAAAKLATPYTSQTITNTGDDAEMENGPQTSSVASSHPPVCP